MKNKKYFTTGELAKLTGLSKQLLIFYDKKNFFTATSTGENGYRYYLLSKYFQLKILITLRKMDIPLEEIYEYLKRGDDRLLLLIYKKKLAEYKSQIEALEKKSLVLEKRIQSIERCSHLILNQVFITELEEDRKYYHWDIDMATPVKERISQIAASLRPYLQDENCFSDSIMGYILPIDSLHQESPAMKYTFLTHYSPEISDFSKVSVHTMDKGVYLKIYGYGHYGVIAPDTKNVLLDFIKRNQLKTDDHYIVFPFNQCWMTNKNPWLMTTMLRIRS